jgi:hypothetical protein
MSFTVEIAEDYEDDIDEIIDVYKARIINTPIDIFTEDTCGVEGNIEIEIE